jgi:outer membrane receptor for ferrienterochelin and colicins
MIRLFIIVISLLFFNYQTYAQRTHTDANIVGHVVSGDEHIPFVNITIKGTTIGTLTDRTGHYQLINVPLGQITVVASFIGYKTQEITVITDRDKTIEVKFDLEQDLLGLEEVVISGTRSTQKRSESSLIVNTISPEIFARAQAITLSEGLGFTPGVRMETNCSNCGFTQVRMNGMDGAYSQILINGRPIFSGLAGVYGLELIPSSMIDKVEVIRGGGSALYGSNAIGGTINLILKDQLSDSYELGVNSGMIGMGLKNAGSPAQDHSVNFNSSFVSDDHNTGLVVYGFHRNRQALDVNNDDFSELTQLKNTTIGARYYHRFGFRNKLSFDFYNINENRRGGNRFDYPEHEADIAESLKHNIVTGAVSYEQFFREHDLFSIYASGQYVNRDSYYGAGRSLKGYGSTYDFTYNTGLQYKFLSGFSSIIAGIENTGGNLSDKKLGYRLMEEAELINNEIFIPEIPNTVTSRQKVNTTSVFGHFEQKINALKISLGGRFDNYIITNKESDAGSNSGKVFSPRIGLLYDIADFFQVRASYSRGYRAPQIFDEDLHIEVSEARKVIYRNSPDLKQETSNSYMLSLDFNRSIGRIYYGLLIEGFHTRLMNPFQNEFGLPDEDGEVIYTRVNADAGATVQGINIEFNMVPGNNFSLSSGFTMQTSLYDEIHEFGKKEFFRTPRNYGFLTADWNFYRNYSFSTTGNYTGKMLVPYFGPALAEPEEGELRESEKFFDLGFKFSRNIRFNYSNMEVSIGVKNILNSYQSDFDTGEFRDPGYVYGPALPRMIYFGIRIGNIF